MDKFKVYLLIFNNTPKVYVGITTQTLKRRFNQHINVSNSEDTKLYRHIRKYGVVNCKIQHNEINSKNKNKDNKSKTDKYFQRKGS